MKNSRLVSARIKVAENMRVAGNPAADDFSNQELTLFFKDTYISRNNLQDLQNGKEMVVAFAEFAVADGTASGHVFHGALPEWLYFVKADGYADIGGRKTGESLLIP
ncbi:hypothetical protein SDC9_212163 [bioreactor metagenome]|uniref:Uncharacterized protein n=1 Tax=bioreactor metagenome TaxID=1076179 RepID=A0A645JLC3_9ZZZZ